MLSQRTIEKRVEEELARDERWRVIVRGNNWLCPFCLRIGARELRMDEAIEEKIALHFLAGCAAWDYFQAEPQPIERLRQTARYLVFKQRVLRWILDDPRFRVHDEERRWLCPYCLESVEGAAAPEDAGWAERAEPEEHPYLGRVVGHLLQCARFAEGEDTVASARDLEEARARTGKKNKLQRIKRRFEREPAFRLVDHDKQWMCPFCAHVLDLRLEVERPDEAFFQAAQAHLDGCKAHAVLGGTPRPIDELRARLQAGARARQLERIRHKMEGHAIWRVRDVDQQWLCPYCAVVTAVHYPPKGADGAYPPAEMERFLEQALEHLGGCDEYRRPEARIRSRAEMAQAVQDANLSIDRHRRVRKALVDNAMFGVVDAVANWLCPYCRKLQKQIHIYPSVESAQFEKTVEQVVHHLWKGCEAFREDQPPRGTRRDLEALLAQDPIRSASGVLESGAGSGVRVISGGESMDEKSWARIKADLEVVKDRFERARRRESSLREARQKQLRLLPDIPNIPGYEFARIYHPCEAVGGDFYCFFQAADSQQAFAVGDITGHGIEAALLMGLAKKLLEVHGRGRGSTAQTLCLANRDIFSDLDDRTFVTVFYGLLDTERRLLKFSRAGHDPLVLFNPRRQPRLSVIDCKGMALGMDEGPIFEQTLEEVEIALLPGDLVIQYTDGVTETMNLKNEQFGRERLYQVIEENGHFEAEYVLWKIEKATEAFRGERRRTDDLTLVAVKVLP